MKKILYWLPSIIFNVVEVLIIGLVGTLLKLPFKDMLVIFTLFVLVRLGIGGAMHYKAWQKCILWSTLMFLSLFVVVKADWLISLIMSVFCGYILTNKANLKDIFMWSGRTSKYEALKDLIALSPNNAIIIENEEYWRKNYPIRYEIFRYYFRENKTYKEIAEIKNFDDNTIIKRECATIYSILEKPLNLPPINRD